METPEAKQSPQDIQRTWVAAIESAEAARKSWLGRGRKIQDRYRSEKRSEHAPAGSRFNLFWSNIETIGPATYSRRPKAQVSRRYHDQDPIGRLAGQILERGLQYEIDLGLNFHTTVQKAVKDRLLPGIGVAWVRYEPSFTKEKVELPDPPEAPTRVVQKEVETVASEFTPVDYVYWEDFLISPCRSWEDKEWVSRRLLFPRDRLEKRFADSHKALGGDLAKIPYTYTLEERADLPKKAEQAEGEGEKYAEVFEIWSGARKQLIWICRSIEVPLDVQDDKAKLEGFYPCPRPLLATTTNDQFLPVPDFLIYQDQLRELDDITARISLLTKALRAVGVYDASQTALQGLLNGAAENAMIPVNAWAAFAEKGGLKGSVDFLPLDVIAKILSGLYEARESVKQTIYEITGMADIVRGQSVASETLGAQQIKAKFANLRLSSRQSQVAEFTTQILQLKAEIMCDQYTPETLAKIAAADQIQEVMQHPERLQAALALLKQEKLRQFRVEVMADSMIELDAAEEQSRRTEFMSAVSNFMLAAKNVASLHPAMMPVTLEMLKFVVRGFSVGRSLESSIEDASQKILEQLQNPQPPQPDPNEVLKKEIEQMRQQGEDRRMQWELQSEERLAGLEHQLSTQAETMKAQIQQASEERSASREDWKAQQEAIRAERDAELGAMREQLAAQDTSGAVKQQEALIREVMAELGQLAKLIQAPRKKVPRYDPESGDILDVTEVLQ